MSEPNSNPQTDAHRATQAGRGDGSQPRALCELLNLSPLDVRQCDIARMNLLCAVGLPGAENLNVERYLRQLDDWVVAIEEIIEHHRGRFDDQPEEYNHSEPYWRMLTLTTILQLQLGIRYNPKYLPYSDPNDVAQRHADVWDWKDSRDLFIHGLIKPPQTGTCVSLPVFVVAIGRRLGYPLKLVHTLAHVFARWDGEDHENPAWREKFNIECHGKGMNCEPDEHYQTWPVKWNAWQWDMELNKRTKPLFLRSLDPEEELASFVSQRAHCLEAHEKFDEAWGCYDAALRFAPHNDSYAHWLRQVHKSKLDHALKPWKMSAAEYMEKLKSHHRGIDVLFPWGDGDAPPYELPAGALRSAEGVPFQSAIADPFAAARMAIGVSNYAPPPAVRNQPASSINPPLNSSPIIDVVSLPNGVFTRRSRS